MFWFPSHTGPPRYWWPLASFMVRRVNNQMLDNWLRNLIVSFFSHWIYCPVSYRCCKMSIFHPSIILQIAASPFLYRLRFWVCFVHHSPLPGIMSAHLIIPRLFDFVGFFLFLSLSFVVVWFLLAFRGGGLFFLGRAFYVLTNCFGVGEGVTDALDLSASLFSK